MERDRGERDGSGRGIVALLAGDSGFKVLLAIYLGMIALERIVYTTAARGFPFGDPLAPLFALPAALLGITPEAVRGDGNLQEHPGHLQSH